MRRDVRLQGYFDQQLETRPNEKRREDLNRQVIAFVHHTYKYSMAMREKMNAANVEPEMIKSINDLQKIPVTRKDEIVDRQRKYPPFGGFLAVKEEDLDWVFISPGPIFDPMVIDLDRTRSTASIFFGCGFRKGDMVLNTWSYHMVPAGLVFDLGLRHLGCTVIPAGTGNREVQIRILQDLKANGFIGTASFLMNILEKAEDMGIDPRNEFKLEVALAGGEPAGGPIRKRLEDEYGIVTSDAYGTADVGLIAYECREKQECI